MQSFTLTRAQCLDVHSEPGRSNAEYRAVCLFKAVVGIGLLFSAPIWAQVKTEIPMPRQVNVHIAARGTEQVPDTLFGGFLEPIGNSINGGLEAEVLVNRSLEAGLWNHVNLEKLFQDEPELIESSDQTGIPLPWEPLNSAAGNRYELHVGQAANSWQSLEVMGQPDELTGIKQKVYLPVQRVLRYKVSAYARHISGPTELTFTLRDRESGKVLAQASLDAPAAEWTKYSTTLELNSEDVHRLEAFDFALQVEGSERVEVDQFSLMPADAIGTFDPDVVAKMKAMHVTELRFGGNFSSYYHWRDGIGPQDKRVTMKNIAWGIPEYNDFGTDEFLQLCDLIGAIPQFNLNMGSGTPEMAADWVRYIKAHRQGPVFYEIGNELYGKWQVGYPTLSEISARTLAFSKAVRAADPNGLIIATGLGPMGGARWNAEQLKNPPGTFDFLSMHFIRSTNRPEMMSPKPDFVAAAAYALPYAVGPYFDRAQAQVDQNPALRDKVHFAITEWLFNSKGFGERNFTNESPSWMNEGGAVLAAGFLNTLLRHSSEVKIADMTGIMEFAGVWKRREQVYAVPAYYAFQMYTAVKGDTILPLTSDSGTYSVRGGVAPLDKLEGIPWIDVVATRSRDGKMVTLLCVNRSLERDVPTHFDFGSLHITGAGQMQQITSVSRYERNDEVEPEHVMPVPSAVRTHGGNMLTVTLPKESVSVIRIPVS